MIGAMAVIHAVAMVINYFRLELEERNDREWLTIIVTVVFLILLLLSIPVSFVSFILQMFYQGRRDQLHTKELINEANKNYALGKQDAKDLKKELDLLKEQQPDIKFEAYRRGEEIGYQNGYVDGYIACCEESLSDEDLHFRDEAIWNRTTKESARESLKLKERFEQVKNEIYSRN